MNWQSNGVWGDVGMPDVDQMDTIFFGTRISPILDLTEALEYLRTIRVGHIEWDEFYDGMIDKGIVQIEVSLDGGQTWDPAENGGEIEGVHDDMQLQMRQHLRGPIMDVFPSTLELQEVRITLSDQLIYYWDELGLRLVWDGGEEI